MFVVLCVVHSLARHEARRLVRPRGLRVCSVAVLVWRLCLCACLRTRLRVWLDHTVTDYRTRASVGSGLLKAEYGVQM